MLVANKDPGKGHFYVSVVKSILRFAAGGVLVSLGLQFSQFDLLTIAGILFIMAEVLGIVEELV